MGAIVNQGAQGLPIAAQTPSSAIGLQSAADGVTVVNQEVQADVFLQFLRPEVHAQGINSLAVQTGHLAGAKSAGFRPL